MILVNNKTIDDQRLARNLEKARHFCEPQIPKFNPWNTHGGR